MKEFNSNWVFSWAADSNGRCAHIDQCWAEATGQSVDEALGDGWLSIVHPEDSDKLRNGLEDAVAARSRIRMEFRLRQADGSYVWALIAAFPQVDAGGAMAGYAGSIVDIQDKYDAHAELLESRQRIGWALNAANAGVWEWSLSDNRNIWCDNLWSLLGLPSSRGAAPSFELWASTIHEDDRDRVLAAVSEAAAAGKEFEVQWRVRLPEGAEQRWLLSRGQPLTAPDGRVERYIGVVFDITERKAFEDGLRRSDRRYRLLYESLRDPFARTDTDGRILEFNQLFCELTGYSAAELKDLTYRDLTPEPWHEYEAGIIRDEIMSRGYSEVYEKEYRRKDGTVIPVELRTILSSDEQGRPVGMWALVRDITERKRSEAALRDSQQRMLLATQSARVGIWEWNTTTNEIFWDDAMFRIYGMEPARGNRMRFQDWSDALEPDEVKRQTELLQAHARDGGVHRREFRIRRKDTGETRHIQAVETVRIGTGEGDKWVVGTNRDVTDEKRAKEVLLEADRRKDEFLAVLAHELRNPLAPIRTGVEFLQSDEKWALTSPAQKILDMMERQVSNLVRIVDDLLEVSRISQGKIALQKEPVDIETVLRSAIETSKPFIDKGKHCLSLAAPSERLTVHGDPTRLVQVFANILNNAAKFTPQGGRIAVSAEVRGAQAVVTITDNGNGIGADALPQIFKMFAQAHERGAAGGGLGIGLALVHELIELHGGSVSARSEGIGKGSEFIVTLPLDSAANVEATGSRPATEAGALAKRVLVINDNRDAADSMGMLLETLGATVRVVYDGHAGAEAAQEFLPDVVLLDLGMPGLDGWATAKKIRSACGGETPTIIAVTGWGQEDARARTSEAGFDGHLTKPVSAEALGEALSRAKTRQVA